MPCSFLYLITQPDIGEYLEDEEIPFGPGDKVILYTDGVTEAHNEKEEMYSLERLTEQVKKHGHKQTDELMASLKEDVFAFIGVAEQYDDITLVVMDAE